MSRPVIWPWLKPFVVLLLVVAIPPLMYWFVYVKHTVQDAKQQTYATLAAVVTNFRDRVAAHDQIAITAETTIKPAAVDLQSLKEHLQSVLQPREALLVPGQDAHLDVVGENGGLYVHVGKIAKDTAGCKYSSGCTYRAVVALENLIPWQIVQSEFDGLLVLNDKGLLLAQDRRLPAQALGMRMSVLDGTAPMDYAALLGGQGVGETAKEGGAKPSQAPPSLSPFDFRAERSIQVAGVDYLVFLQPMSVLVTAIAGASDPGNATPGKTIRFIVCGLVRKDRLRSEAIKLSPQTMTLTGSLVALGLFSIPFLKLRFIGARERMRRRDLWLLCASLLCVTALMVLVLLDRHTRDKLNDRFDNGLRQFSASILKNLRAESAAAMAQLNTTATAMLQSMNSVDINAALSEQCGSPQAAGSILASSPIAGAGVENFAYADFEVVYVTDRCGRQLRKWMPRTTPTPSVDSLSQPFYVATFALRNRPYVYSTLTARASGLLLGLYTQPLDLKERQFGPQVEFANRTGIVAMATPLRSVNEPVVPRPFQFVLVNRQGEVTFQQAQGSFRGERFYEAVLGGQVLEKAARDNARLDPDKLLPTSGVVTREYRGRSYRMHAVEVPELQQTLVAFYETSTIDSLAARIFGTAAAFSTVLIACVLFGAALAACWFGERAHDWLWPTASRTTMYLLGTALCVTAMIAASLVRTVSASNIMAAILMLAPIGALLLLGSGYVTRTLARLIEIIGLPDVPIVAIQRMRFAYQSFAVAGLLAFIAFPAALIVDDAFTLHTSTYEIGVTNDLDMADMKARRSLALNAINVRAPLPPLNCKAKAADGVRDPRCMLPERTYATQENYTTLQDTRRKLAVYRDCTNLRTGDDVDAAEKCVSPPIPWSFTVGVANQLTRFSSKPELSLAIATFAASQSGLSAPALISGFAWSIWSVGGLLALIAALSLLVGSVAKHVLGIGLSNRLALDDSKDFVPADNTRWLVLRPTTTATAAVKQPVVHMDLRDATLAPIFASPGKGTTLVVHHVETRVQHAEWREALLLLLRSPAAGCIVLASEIDPLHYLLNRVREIEEELAVAEASSHAELQKALRKLEEEVANWSMALRTVRKIRFLVPAIPISGKSNAARLAHECSGTDTLTEIGRRLGRPENHLEEYRWDEVVGFVLDAAEPYYRSLWHLCSREEQLVLIQLAQEGLVNPKRIDIIKRLARRRLVTVEPRFCIVNESFRRFVREVESRDHIVAWERAPTHSAWARLGTPLYALAAVIIAILLFTEQEMFTSIVAVATGAAGALGSMRSLYSSTVKPVVTAVKNV